MKATRADDGPPGRSADRVPAGVRDLDGRARRLMPPGRGGWGRGPTPSAAVVLNLSFLLLSAGCSRSTEPGAAGGGKGGDGPGAFDASGVQPPEDGAAGMGGADAAVGSGAPGDAAASADARPEGGPGSTGDADGAIVGQPDGGADTGLDAGLDAASDGPASGASDARQDATTVGDGTGDLAGDTGASDAGAAAPSGPGRWQVGPPIQSMARQEVGVGAIGDIVYVVGGYSRLVDAFDTRTGQWRALAPLPSALDHSNVAAVGGKLYVLGATEAEKTIPGDVNAFLTYDPALNRWSPVRPMPPGTERAASGVAVLGGKVYIVGGWRNYGVATSFVSSYDTGSDAWEVLPDILPKRDHLVAGAVGGIIYAIGGRNGTIGTPTGRVDAFDPATRAWSARAPMITPRGGTAGVVLFDEIYVFGGEGNTATGSNGVFPQAELYDPLNNAWRSLSPLIVPKHGIGAAAVAGKIYIPGGAIRQGGGAQVASMEIFVP